MKARFIITLILFLILGVLIGISSSKANTPEKPKNFKYHSTIIHQDNHGDTLKVYQDVNIMWSDQNRIKFYGPDRTYITIYGGIITIID